MKLVIGFIRLLSRLPMGVLYSISDVLYLLAYRVIGYRRKVVRTNLLRSFPEKSIKEIRAIESNFYHFFCDIAMETVKQGSISKEEIYKRMTFSNYDVMLSYLKQGRSVMLMMGHYCNWEWGLSGDSYMPDGAAIYPVYQKLNNKVFDDFMLHNRNNLGARCIEKDELVRTMVRMRDKGICGMFCMISDQSPMQKFIRYRMNFLNQDTPVFLGTEQLARKYDYPVFYFDVERTRRGYYHAKIVTVSLEPAKSADYEITTRFMQLLEESIRRRPELWLWTHNRWKHSNSSPS